MIENLDRTPRKNGICKQVKSHVRAAPGAVNREKPESRARQAVKVAIDMGHQFIAFFAGCIKACRMIDVVMNRIRPFPVKAIHRRRRGKDQMPDFCLAAAFQQIAKAHQIGLDIGARIDQAVAHPGLGGQVHHMINIMFGKQALKFPAIGKINLCKGERGFLRMIFKICQARLFQSRIVIVVQVVNPQHLMAIGQ